MSDRILHRIPDGFTFWCPGCECAHGVWVNKPNDLTGARWTFNGSEDRPSFSPSILVKHTKDVSDEEIAKMARGETVTPVDLTCHLYVRDGQLQFLSDCTHKLAGQSVPMEAF